MSFIPKFSMPSLPSVDDIVSEIHDKIDNLKSDFDLNLNDFDFTSDTFSSSDQGLFEGVNSEFSFDETWGVRYTQSFDKKVSILKGLDSFKFKGYVDAYVALNPYFYFEDGDVDTEIPLNFIFSVTDAGTDQIRLNTGYHIAGGDLSIESPNLQMGLNLIVDVSGEAYIRAHGHNFTIVPEFDTGRQTINLFDSGDYIDEALEFSIPGSGSEDVATLTLNVPHIEAETQIANHSQLTCSGQDPLAELNVDIDALMSTSLGLPPLAYEIDESIGVDLGWLGKPKASVEGHLNLLDIDFDDVLSLAQQVTVSVDDLPLLISLEDGREITGYHLGDAITFTAPENFDVDQDGDQDGLLDFNAVVDMEALIRSKISLVNEATLSFKALQASFDVDTPIYDGSYSLNHGDFLYEQNVNLGALAQSATLYDETWDLDGFNSIEITGAIDIDNLSCILG